MVRMICEAAAGEEPMVPPAPLLDDPVCTSLPPRPVVASRDNAKMAGDVSAAVAEP